MKNLVQKIDNRILTIIISRPHVLNALNGETIDEIGSAIKEANENKDVRGIIITGEGEKAFVAGADIKELSSLTNEQAVKFSRKGHEVFLKIEKSSKPVIAAIHGFALGGGCELAMACHIRIASEISKFGQPEVNLGIIPGYGGTQRLTQLVGRGKSLELMLTGDLITAHEAKLIGLINHVVSTKEELLTFSNAMMIKMINKAPRAVENIIKSVNAGFDFEGNGYQAEASYFGECAATDDFKEGTAAFIEKRQPNFKGK